jgi:glyoxylase-like metal-dependent hydrolase (beta-lactamase superfamily II)
MSIDHGLINRKSTKLSFTNVFLLECEGGYLLIDTSYNHLYPQFRSWLRRIGVGLDEIRYLLLTHHHDDRAGFAKALVEDTGARLIAHENAVPYLKEGAHHMDIDYLNTCTEITLRLFSFFRRHTYPSYEAKDDDILIRGDEPKLLKEIGIDGEILYTPGHTDDSITVLMSNGNAFVGDAAMNFLGFCRIRYRPIVYRSIDDMYRSLEYLIERGAQTIYPSYGDAFDAEKLRQGLQQRY